MRQTFAVVRFFALLLAILPVTSAQPEDDDGGDDDADSGAQLFEQAADAIYAGPAKPSLPTPAKIKSLVHKASSLSHTVGAPSPAAPDAPAAAVEEPSKEEAVKADAKNAHKAAETAKNAAAVANKVARHSVKLSAHAQSALKDARNALHKARVDTSGLSSNQRKSLKAAEAKLKEATKKAEYGAVKTAKYVKSDVSNKRLEKLERKMESIKKEESKLKKGGQGIDKKASAETNDDELEAMRKEIEALRAELKKKEGDKTEDDAVLKELRDQIKEMEKEDKKDKKTKKSHDELKAEIERLRSEIKNMQDEEKVAETPVADSTPEQPKVVEKKVEKYTAKMKPLEEVEEEDQQQQEEGEETQERGQATPVEEKGLDIDTAMPYGDLEPFGREDTAQELTENSIRESDGMVDQIEKAEVSEEKRSVFRALTRLRGAAITSFDGVARSQTGNIDEYNKIHKWRETHPLHHLADEESDISKWAFPEDAD